MSQYVQQIGPNVAKERKGIVDLQEWQSGQAGDAGIPCGHFPSSQALFCILLDGGGFTEESNSSCSVFGNTDGSGRRKSPGSGGGFISDENRHAVSCQLIFQGTIDSGMIEGCRRGRKITPLIKENIISVLIEDILMGSSNKDIWVEFRNNRRGTNLLGLYCSLPIADQQIAESCEQLGYRRGEF